MGLNHDTPLEKYKLKGIDVWVKRDDLHNGDLDLPPWAKIEGVKRLMQYTDIEKPLVHLTVRGSYTGWVLGHYGKELGYDIKIAYGNSKNYPRESLDRIESYGVELVPLKPNMMKILYNSMKKMANEKGWQRLPYAFDSFVYHNFWRDKIWDFKRDYRHLYRVGEGFDNLVILGGSGVTSVGMINGFMDVENWPMKRQVHVISSSTISSVTNKLKSRNVYYPNNVFVHDTPYDFYDEMDFYETPFPCNPNWDKKAWWWLENNIEKLNGKTLFWNIGA